MIASALRRLVPFAAVVAAAPSVGGAQVFRALGSWRQQRDSAATQVRVSYSTGRMHLRAGAGTIPLLYALQLRYDAERADPLVEFDPAAHLLQLGVRRRHASLPGERNRGGTLDLDLSPALPLDLSVDLGAAEADMDLTRLRLERLRVQSGASAATIRFDSLNGVPMRSLDLEAGAAGIQVLGIANANVAEVNVEAGVGGVALDFGGAWTHDTDLRLQTSIGAARVTVPSDVGVRLEISSVLAGVTTTGLLKRGDYWYSENFDQAPHKLRIHAQTILGSFEIRRVPAGGAAEGSARRPRPPGGDAPG